MSLADIMIGAHALDNSWDSQGSPIHSKYDISIADLIEMAAASGSGIVRVPTDLSTSGPDGAVWWQIDLYVEILQSAAANGLKVIFEPGQTPIDLSSNGSLSGTPGTQENIEVLAQRFGDLVGDVYAKVIETDPTLLETIAGWEIGNEPNLSYNYNGDAIDENNLVDNRFYSVSAENGSIYADYLHAVSEAIKANVFSENGENIDINVIAAGIAHNDKAYLNAMFERLQELDADIDGFTIHPYTTNVVDDFGNQIAPESGRPTDWVYTPTDYSESWDTYYSFQGALMSIQEVMEAYGYSNVDLWITEIGVPSYLGYRNAGEDGAIDQARWIVEALGVLDSWDNPNLKAVILHQILDDVSFEDNQSFNAYDLDQNNDGTWLEAEGSFGLYHEVDGEIVAKPISALLEMISSGTDFQYLNIESNYTNSTFDYSQANQSTGILTGVIVLTHDGNDNIIGSNFDDSIFAGEGDDTLSGGLGDDRLYGGAGDDLFVGGQGADIFIGNTNGLTGDTVSYQTSESGIIADLTNGLTQGGEANGDLFDGIENLIGSDFDDTLIGDGTNNTLNGGGGNNVLTGGLGNDVFVYDDTSSKSTIMDFEDGIDKIDISTLIDSANNHSFFYDPAANNVGSFNCVLIVEKQYKYIDISAKQLGAETIVFFEIENKLTKTLENASILLKDFDVENLDSSDFII